jgi:hypothetical protein
MNSDSTITNLVLKDITGRNRRFNVAGVGIALSGIVGYSTKSKNTSSVKPMI